MHHLGIQQIKRILLPGNCLMIPINITKFAWITKYKKIDNISSYISAHNNMTGAFPKPGEVRSFYYPRIYHCSWKGQFIINLCAGRRATSNDILENIQLSAWSACTVQVRTRPSVGLTSTCLTLLRRYDSGKLLFLWAKYLQDTY